MASLRQSRAVMIAVFGLLFLLLTYGLALSRPAGAFPAAPAGNGDGLPTLWHTPLLQAVPAGDELSFTHLSTADGLSNNVVLAILQDQQGFLWFGTEYGLDQYDGYGFTVYRRDPDDPTSLADNVVYALCEDRMGNLWVGTRSGLNRLDRRTGVMTRYQNDPADPTTVTDGAVHAVYEDRQGTVWVGTDHGLNRYNPENDSFANFLINLVVRAIYEDRQGVLWVGTNAGLVRFERETGGMEFLQHRSDDPTSISSNWVSTILEDRQGALWVGTGSGACRHNGVGGFECAGVGVPFLTMCQDRAGSYWAGFPEGLLRADTAAGTQTFYRHDPDDPTSLSGNVVSAIYQDRAGTMWIGTDGGVSRVDWRPRRFTLYPQSNDLPDVVGEQPLQLDGLSDPVIQAVLEDRSGVLWVGTRSGGLNRLDRDATVVAVYRHNPEDPTSLSSNDVRALYEDQGGVLWVGTAQGLQHYDPQTDRFVTIRPALLFPLDLTVAAIAPAQSGDLWIGAYGGLYRLGQDLGILVQQAIPGLPVPRDTVWAVQDRTGILWVSVPDDGVRLWDPVSGDLLQHFRHDPTDPTSLSSDTVIAFYEDAAGTIWLGTFGGGLNRYDRATATFLHYTEDDGLPSDVVSCITADDEGFLWLGTTRGLSRFDPRSETFHPYDTRDGLQGGIFLACSRTDHGELLFGGTEGLSRFDPQQIVDNPHIPPVVITRLILHNQTVRTDLSAGEQITLSYRDNYLSFEFAALDYTDPDRNQYAYMMEGFDRDWVYAGTRRHVDYPNLHPGAYVFRVRGSNNDGVWNQQGTAVAIRIRAPFWQTWWFVLLTIILLAAGLYGGYRLRVRALVEHRRELEVQVRERTHEIEHRTQELEALYRADEELYRHLHMERVLQALVDTAVETLGADKGTLLVWDDRHERLVVRAARGFSPETIAAIALAPGEGVAGQVAISGTPEVVGDSWEDPRVSRQITEAEGIRSFMQVPVMIGDEVFGVFSADYLLPRTFQHEDLRLLIALAQRAALAIENAQLYEQAQELAAVHERNRLARELHDSVTQSIYAVTLYASAARERLSAGQPAAAGEEMDKLRRVARDALAEMRLLVYELRPPILEQEGLAAALEARLEAVEERSGLQTRLTVQGSRRLPSDVEEGLYRIAIEALNNALKHARAHSVGVSLRLGPASVRLEVTDDGVGFDHAAASGRGGMGLVSMAERAAQLGGQLTIQSVPGEGTAIQVEVGL